MPHNPPEYPLLAIDTASRRTWVGLKLAPDALVALCEDQDPSKTLFSLVGRVLEQTDTSMEDLRSIAFCAGPGSMLGARTTSMAIRSWKAIGIPAAQHVFRYNSLQIGGLIAEAAPDCSKNGLVVTDARRSSWNALAFPIDPNDSLQLIPNEDLEKLTSEIVTFAEFPAWTQTDAKSVTLSYDPTPIFEGVSFLDILSPVDEAAPVTVRQNEFKKWEARIHSASER